MTFYEAFRQLRTHLRLSQRDYAIKLRISPQYVCDLEHERRLPSVKIVERICDDLGLRICSRREWHKKAAYEHGWKVQP